MSRRVTMKGLAEKAGLSRQTVSLALGPRARLLKESTRQCVVDAAREMGYRRFSSAVAMTTGKTQCIALLLSTQSSRSLLPEYVLGGIQETLHERHLHLVVESLPDPKLTDEQFIPKLLHEVMSDGLLINYNARIPPRMLRLIDEFALPAVWINAKRNADAVYPDDFDAALRGTRKLLDLGHRRVCYLDFTHCKDETPWHYSGVDRRAGYEQVMSEAGLAAWRHGSLEELAAGRIVASTVELLRRPDHPTAILAYGGKEVGTVMVAAATLGLAVPEDISIITFDRRVDQVFGPRPATMIVPEHEVGRQAAMLLLERIEAPEQAPLESHAIPFDFNPGETLAPAE